MNCARHRARPIPPGRGDWDQWERRPAPRRFARRHVRTGGGLPRDAPCPFAVLDVLRKMVPLRQRKAAELMVGHSNFGKLVSAALLAATQSLRRADKGAGTQRPETSPGTKRPGWSVSAQTFRCRSRRWRRPTVSVTCISPSQAQLARVLDNAEAQGGWRPKQGHLGRAQARPAVLHKLRPVVVSCPRDVRTEQEGDAV